MHLDHILLVVMDYKILVSVQMFWLLELLSFWKFSFSFEIDGNLDMGFCAADIFLTEGIISNKAGRKASLGTCVLLQNPATWGEKDTCIAPILWFQPKKFTLWAMRRFVVTGNESRVFRAVLSDKYIEKNIMNCKTRILTFTNGKFTETKLSLINPKIGFQYLSM